jgi:hypothetical protein
VGLLNALDDYFASQGDAVPFEEVLWDQAKHDPSKPLDPKIVDLMKKLAAKEASGV